MTNGPKLSTDACLCELALTVLQPLVNIQRKHNITELSGVISELGVWLTTHSANLPGRTDTWNIDDDDGYNYLKGEKE